MMEIGYGQRPALEALLGGWSEVSFVPDLQGIPRVAQARTDVMRDCKSAESATRFRIATDSIEACLNQGD